MNQIESSRTHAAPSAPSGLVVADVSHAFGRTTVVSEASLTVGPGEVHCMLGPSGSGKTTLLRLVAGLERIQHGRVAIFGLDVASPTLHVPPEKRSVGFVFQDYALFPHLSVRDNVCFAISSPRRADRIERARSLLASVGMSDFERAMPHTLSGGQQQRVALARALGRHPTVMLLDEPFSGLDTRLRDEVRGTTIELLKGTNVATLMVTHDPHEAMMVADTISIIHDGYVEQSGTPHALYSRPNNERVATSLGVANCFHGQVDGRRVPTPLGPIDASDLNDGDRATVIVRPESLTVESVPSPLSVPATLISARHLGECMRLEVALPCGRRVIAISSVKDDLRIHTEVHVSVTASHISVHRSTRL